MLSLNTALLGIIAGALATIAATLIKGRLDYSKELMKHAIDTAHKDFEASLQLKKDNLDFDLYPMSAYISYHYNFLKLLDKGASPSAAAIKSLGELEKLFDVYKQTKIVAYKKDWASG